MTDLTSRTEAQAAASARLDAWPEIRDERDEPGINAADHDCRDMPHPDDCWGCAAFVREYELREMAKVRAEKDAEHARNWWAS